ncbi:MAG: hypothetical protein JXD23_13910 [Spirochaetales bacterium]|nr:hypothetical protein [Spirochaetales bacterium]
MKIMIFTEGTIIMHKSGVGQSREQRVRQVKDGDPSIHDYRSYVPIGDAVTKLLQWKNQGAGIVYLTSRRDEQEVSDIQSVLRRWGFPHGELAHRRAGEEYKDVVVRIPPDVLIEDDCESIGGAEEMTVTHMNPLLKANIISLPVREFGGIDHLENHIFKILRNKKRRK